MQPCSVARYQRRRPEKTPLHKIASECLEGWLEDRAARDRLVAGYVEETSPRGELQAGIHVPSLGGLVVKDRLLQSGFIRAHDAPSRTSRSSDEQRSGFPSTSTVCPTPVQETSKGSG